MATLLLAIRQVADATTALIDAAGGTESDARQQLRGSQAAADIGRELSGAGEELQQAFTELDRVIDLAEAEGRAYRETASDGPGRPRQGPARSEGPVSPDPRAQSPKLDWSQARVSADGVHAVEQHLARFERGAGEAAMVGRLHAILAGLIDATDFDLRFYTHELRESFLTGRRATPTASRTTRTRHTISGTASTPRR